MPIMNAQIKTLQVSSRQEWRNWLEENHDKEKEIWLVYYKRHTCEPRIPYNDAVEEAICFGWIDSIIKRIDENTYCQKFTPRRKKSNWSLLNVQRAKKMISKGKMTERGFKAYAETKENPSLIIKPEDKSLLLDIPGDLGEALHARGDAFKNFMAFPKSYRRMCMRWINATKKSDTRQGRIAEVASKAAANEKISPR